MIACRLSSFSRFSPSALVTTPHALVIAQICRGWRTVIWTTPDAWRRLMLYNTQWSIPALHCQGTLWLVHSRLHAFDIARLRRPRAARAARQLAAAARAVLPQLHRCRTVELIGRTHETIAIVVFADDPARTALRHLIITLNSTAELDDDDGAPTFCALQPYFAVHAHGGTGRQAHNARDGARSCHSRRSWSLSRCARPRS